MTDFPAVSERVTQESIDAYAETVHARLKQVSSYSGKQPGDPLRAVQAMIQVVESPNPPLHLLLGKSALQRFRSKLDNWQKEIAAWEQVSVGADFPEGK